MIFILLSMLALYIGWSWQREQVTQTNRFHLQQTGKKHVICRQDLVVSPPHREDKVQCHWSGTVKLLDRGEVVRLLQERGYLCFLAGFWYERCVSRVILCCQASGFTIPESYMEMFSGKASFSLCANIKRQHKDWLKIKWNSFFFFSLACCCFELCVMHAMSEHASWSEYFVSTNTHPLHGNTWSQVH